MNETTSTVVFFVFLPIVFAMFGVFVIMVILLLLLVVVVMVVVVRCPCKLRPAPLFIRVHDEFPKEHA